VLRTRALHWGATTAEATMPLPGDDLVPNPDLTATRAVGIDTDPADVWPWVAQLGQGRGGFYSYDALENLVGCDIHSADRIEPRWQSPRVGDVVRLAPQVGLDVAAVEPGRALVLHGAVAPGGEAGGTPPYDFSWAFVVLPAAGGSTRLVVRERYAYTTWWAPVLVEPVSWLSLLMSRKMLRGIRERAERPA